MHRIRNSFSVDRIKIWTLLVLYGTVKYGLLQQHLYEVQYLYYILKRSTSLLLVHEATASHYVYDIPALF